MRESKGSTARTGLLLEAALAGRPEAERKLWEVLHPALVRRAARHPAMAAVRRLATPEDVAEEVWVRVYSHQVLGAFEYRGKGSVGRFLGAVLDKTMLDWRRRAQAGKRACEASDGSAVPGVWGQLGLVEPAVAGREPSPSSEARFGELESLCRGILDERSWEIFRLRELDGLSSIEIGERLEMPPSSVRRILAEGKRELRRALEDGPES